MYQPIHRCADRVSPVLTPSWTAIVVAWAAFVLGPLAAMTVVSRPPVVVGILIGLALSILARRVRRIRDPVTRDETTWSKPFATDGGAVREPDITESDGARP